MDAEPPDAAAPVPAHPDRQRRGAARSDDRRARVGEPEPGVLPGRVAHPAVHPSRRRGRLAGPARLGEQRPDDLLLLRGRAGGPARVRPGRAARAQPSDHAGAGGPGRNDRADRHLPGLQRRPAVGARLGHGHVHRYRVRARDPRPGRAAGPGPDADLPAHVRRGGRPGRARDHRDLLQPPHLAPRPAGRAGHLRRGVRRPGGRRPARRRVPGAGGGGVGGVPALRRRSGRGRPGDGPVHAGVPGRARRPGTGHRAVPAVPRAADAGAGPSGQHHPVRVDLAERAAAGDLPPVDELRHRAAVRAGQRGRPDQRPVSRPGVHLTGHPRHPGRVRARQAARHLRHHVPGHLAQQGRSGHPPAGHRSSGRAPSQASGSPSRSSSPRSPSPARSWPRPRSVCWPRRCARRSSPRPCSG